ncbi:hypothetical protein AJ78_04862 [Emergomyces pasteurianus Ep9510]|uniref:tRNA(Phe) 7-[(3-amino-3-carboxypropyl)-4-demethylwyosine(37)-N(4)]-methyltransferase n=1 Tax=Emergomyces pasteurianus Ep9510 TaxID=1447872 RepID=A0A1J9PE03_9EURO|nr:hypothetical protein AJ78_04862 [Emergomyces pasteurianus Ep9510]
MAAPGRGFEVRKQKILRDLSVPDEEYTDLSPKGSVDAGIRDLIHDINQIPGLVTTSSCAGRISVFLEGDGKRAEVNKSASFNEHDNKIMEAEGQVGERSKLGQSQFAPTGGKGSGKWLFVSHEPVKIDLNCEGNYLHRLFNLVPGDDKSGILSPSGSLRLVRFHFEPMILHIMASSLKHAQPVLAAATAAGFRESGIQSLRCLNDTEAYPIVAVRSSGLALESIIGSHQRHTLVREETEEDTAKSVVSEDYLRMLLALANERFKTNANRRERFWAKLKELCTGRPEDVPSKRAGWEDPEVRRQRKREEGLRRSIAAREAQSAQRDPDTPIDTVGQVKKG